MKRSSPLSNFTSVIDDDDLSVSQPLSLPLSNDKEVASIESQETTIIGNDGLIKPERGTGQKGCFRSIEEIDEKYRDVFVHPYFNIVQSRIIDDALYSDKSLVVCAPTGSGKTLIFEMAIVQLLMEIEEKKIDQDFKIIYMAPVKSLCTERLTEWYPKFTKFGLLCIEVTGDTDVDFSQLQPYRIIITTPEKWDMLTRRWRDYTNLVEFIKLFLIDEVHILNDEARGPVLEAVVSRMKTIEASAKSAHRIGQLQRHYQSDVGTIDTPAPKIRFIAVSATVSNPEDVATWLGTPEQPAVFFKFGDECRPVKLNLVVEGYPCAEGSSIFKFDIILNYKLWPIIQRYHNGKPTLIFCNTRKSVALTAEMLSREITVGFTNEQRAKLTALASVIKNKKIQSLILCGVGCHHAGLLYEERVNIENAFRNKVLPFLITTTTLAMGVNLPAHLVIIKNTQQYMNGAYQEYSISTILQMVGRAGRPQYDTEATAVIMTRMADKARYQSLVGGSEPLQSYLHKRLAENLNSEAALGTVTDVAQCVQWVNSTFLSVRAARDPRRYLGLPQNASKQLITKKIEELCVKAMNSLATAGLISMDEASCIQSTDAGRLMSVYYIDVGTMKAIMKLQGAETLEQLLWLVCESHELADMHLRVDERRSLNALNRNNATATIRFPMKGKINSREMKLNCIIQAVLGCLPIPDPSLNQEAFKIMRIADRVCKCLVAYLTSGKVMAENPKCFSAVLNAVILAKCLSAHIWENSPYLSKQLKGIGPTFSSLLASAGKTTFMLLEESHPRDLERIMNKSAPAGNDLRKQISLLPKYRLTIVPIDEKSVRIELVMLNLVYLKENMERLTAGPNHKFHLIVGDSENNLLHYSIFKDSDLLSVYDGCIIYNITRKQSNEHKLLAHCISSNFVGIDDNSEFVFKDLNPNADPFKCTQRESVLRQTNITDVFPRKRKIPKLDITHCKEKKKRDTDVINQFKILRENLETSKNITEDLNREGLTNMILNDVNVSLEPQSKSLSQIYDKLNDTIDLSDQEDHVDDVEIMNILNEIEGEIENKKSNTVTKTANTQQIHSNTENIKSLSAKNRHVSFKLNKNKQKDPKNNFSFMKSIEQKYCENEAVTESDGGFSSAIKDNLNQFIDNIQHKNQNVDTDLLLQIDGKHSGASPEDAVNKIQKNIIMDDTSCQNCTLIAKQKPPEFAQEDRAKDNRELPLPKINNNQLTISTPSNADKLQLKPFSAFDCNVNSTRNDFNNIMQGKPAGEKLKINNSIGFNNFLLPIQQTQTSQNQNISLIQQSAVVQNENAKYRILEIIEPKCNEILKNRENIKYFEVDDDVDVNQYFFSATQINSCTKVLPERQIHIVGRLKVDFNVMEIKTKQNSSNLKCNTSNNVANNENIVAELTETNLDGMTVCSNTLEDSLTQKQINHELVKLNAEKENFTANSRDTENCRKNKVVDVKDILHKYQKLVSINPSQSFNESATEPTNTQNIELEESKKVEVKPKRRYKISDFDKIDIPLPESLASVITKSKMKSQTRDSFHTTTENTNEAKITQPLGREETENEICLIPTTTKEYFNYTMNDDLTISPQLPSDIEIQNDYELSQAMLNPKTLLQSVNDEIIVPPPPEFSDTYSPTYEENDFNIKNCNTYYDFEDDDVSEENAAFEPNSSPKVDWELSNDLISYTPSENTSHTLSLSECLSQRQTKLSKFKFRKYENYKFKK